MGRSAGRRLRSINPFDGSLIGELEVSTAPQIAEMMERCRAAARKWRRIPVEERVEALSPLRELLLRRSEEICELVSREVGEPISETPVTEIHPALESISYYSEIAPALLADRKVEYRGRLKSGKAGLNRYEPVGVVAIISSWVFPFSIPFTQIIPALVAGNGVIFKPSEHAPLIGAMIVDMLKEALPEDLVCLAVGDGEVGRQIIRAGPDRVVFTGRRETGRRVMIEAAERLLPLTLCLSGKGTAIVLEDADLDRAAAGITYGAFLNSGQACGRIEKVYVAESLFDPFVERISEIVGGLKTGDPLDPDTEIGPQTTDEGIERCVR
ncbi:aldehyde dehydrogenase, partial [Candidatus Poribacteria bacterium]